MEEEQAKPVEEPIKTEEIRNPDGTFKQGNPGGPGRPKGKSLKEYWKQRFSDMSDEEKEEFAKKVTPELLWQMAEGRPSQGLGQAEDLEKLDVGVIVLPAKNGTENTGTENTLGATT